MKVLGTFIFIFLLAILLCLSIDILLGFSFTHALYHLLNPFWVIEPGEYVMLILFLLLTIGQQIMISVKNKSDKQRGSN